METYEDDDDTHFCIKCHLTVSGLENYVRHRQSGCRSTEAKPEVAHETPSTPTTVTYPEILNADTFFSSLELQSSTKSNSAPRARTLVERERKATRSEEKNKRKVRKGQPEPEDGSSKDKLLNMPPVVSDLDDLMDHLGIPSLVGFPEIVTSTANKPSASTSGKLTSSAKTSSHENLADSPVDGIMTGSKGSSGERKRSEDPHGVWMEETILTDLDVGSENKEHREHGEAPENEESEGYVEYDYQQDEESDEESADDDIVEQDSYSDDDDDEDREYPVHGHTGGKWKPSELLQDTSRLNEDELDQDEDNQEHPPPSHTGGKWKPADSSQVQRIEENEVAGKEPVASSLAASATHQQQPPPGHTRGKWIPGAGGDLASGYWCDPCGRKLASRLLYNRHLLSDLHARRSIQEIDGDLQLPRGVASLLQRKSARKRRRAALADIKSRSKSSTRNEKEKKDATTQRKTRRREKEIIWCEMCHARVRRLQMGKHLLSHYHCRVAGTNPCNDPAARLFILANMANVVRQCPFQCATCRFYCNTEETFLLHWRSNLHAQKCNDVGQHFKCTPCDFLCEGNEQMERHLVSSAHREFVAMVNGSVPVVVRRQTFFVCKNCNQRFRYNVQLRFHARETGHEGNLSASDEYQSRIICDLCPQVVRSLVALQRHKLSSHNRQEEDLSEDVRPSAPYFCSFCKLNFATASEAVIHRRTLKHKETVKARKFSAEDSTRPGKECPHCGSEQSSLVEHKEHLLQVHPQLCHRCPRCGMLFALPQDVTRHTRDAECTKAKEEEEKEEREERINVAAASNEKEWRCSNCPFVTESQSEFLFHDALHKGSVESQPDEAGSSKAPAKYRCPMCEKIFTKVSLRNHIRSHTGERPFRCVNCSASFSRRSSLTAHRGECVSSPINSSSSSSATTWPAAEADDSRNRRRNHACSECDSAFYTKHALRQHMLRHAGKSYKCGLPGCPTVLRTANELKAHRALVHESSAADRQFQCDECPYSAKTSTQLRRHRKRHESTEDCESPSQLTCPYENCNFATKLGSHLTRHVRLHTGTKPYKCRHCGYASNNLENLRKHVLSTSLHPGKTIYECDACLSSGSPNRFCTNFAKELRAHLLEAHPQEFPKPSDASDHVASIFGTDRR